jgi:hypothetical protein
MMSRVAASTRSRATSYSRVSLVPLTVGLSVQSATPTPAAARAASWCWERLQAAPVWTLLVIATSVPDAARAGCLARVDRGREAGLAGKAEDDVVGVQVRHAGDELGREAQFQGCQAVGEGVGDRLCRDPAPVSERPDQGSRVLDLGQVRQQPFLVIGGDECQAPLRGWLADPGPGRARGRGFPARCAGQCGRTSQAGSRGSSLCTMMSA